MVTFHQKVIREGRELGYLPDTGGVCFGFTMKWIEAALTNKMARFIQFTNLINQGVLKKNVDAARTKCREKKELTKKEQILLDLPAFYEGLLIYQSPHDYRALLGFTPQHHLEYTTLFASSKDIEDQQGLSAHLLKCDVYTEDSLVTYLKSLETIIEESNCPADKKIAIGLRSIDHQIGATYDVRSKRWSVMDINQWPSKTGGAQFAAEKIMRAFSYRKQQEYAISSLLITSGNQKDEPYIKSINQKRLRLNTPLRLSLNAPLLELKDSTMLELIKMAITYSDIETLKNIGKDNISFFYKSEEDGMSLAHQAAIYGNVEIFNLFDSWELDLNIKGKRGFTPALLAVIAGQKHILELLGNVPKVFLQSFPS